MKSDKISPIFMFISMATILFSCEKIDSVDSFSEVMGNYELSDKYSVMQIDYDSGFAGAPETGAHNITVEFSVEDEDIVSEIATDFKDPMTMSGLKEILFSVGFSEEGIPINKNTVCFLQEQWGVAATAVCFKDNIPFYYDRLQTKGNHQRSELTWQVLGKEGIIQKNTCPSDSSIFCSIFKAALENDPFVCDKIETFRDNCEIFS